jgi:hypothetical protein
MATNFLNNLNNSIKINSSTISNAESKDALVALSKRNSGDLNRIADYVNSLIVPTVRTLTSKPRYPFDAVENGLSGLTVITYPESEGNNKFNSEIYWMAGPTEETGRPCTVKESFDYLLANMIDRVVEVRESLTDLNPVMDQLVCSNRDLIRLAVDTMGLKYTGVFNCESSATKRYPIAEHVYQIINQLTGSTVANELNTSSSDYPVLNIPGSAVATETTKGISEVATAKEIAQGAGLNDSESNAELAVTSDRLLLAVNSDNANGELAVDEVNFLREAIKDVADERIAASDIGALANVEPGSPTQGDALVFDGTSWGPSSVNSTAILGSRSVVPTISDITNNLAMDNGISVAYDHVSETNVRTNTYNMHGYNHNYFRSTDEEWTKSHPVNQSLLSKHVPFLFKSAPANGIFNVTIMETANTGIFNLGDAKNNLNPSLNKAREVGFYQNTCSIWDGTTSKHILDPEKILGVCRSDFQYGKIWAEEVSGNISGNISVEYSNFITGNSSSPVECIQESGSTKVMILGPYNVGDKIYLCPGKILDLSGIKNNLGIGISETFINQSIENLTAGAVPVSESIFDLLIREPSQTCVDEFIKTKVLSKSLGIITNKYNSNNDPETDPTNTLCHSLVESIYDASSANNLRSLLIQELTEILTLAPDADPLALLEAEHLSLSKKYTELSLPLVRITI